MSKSMLYAVNTADQTIDAGGSVMFTEIIRQTGNSIKLRSGHVETEEAGYYHVAVNLTIQPAAASAVTAQILLNNNPVPGAVASLTPGAINEAGSVCIPCIVRTYGCPMAEPSVLTVEISGDCTVTNATVEVVH